MHLGFANPSVPARGFADGEPRQHRHVEAEEPHRTGRQLASGLRLVRWSSGMVIIVDA
jgi:hypothetical protein